MGKVNTQAKILVTGLVFWRAQALKTQKQRLKACVWLFTDTYEQLDSCIATTGTTYQSIWTRASHSRRRQESSSANTSPRFSFFDLYHQRHCGRRTRGRQGATVHFKFLAAEKLENFLLVGKFSSKNANLKTQFGENLGATFRAPIIFSAGKLQLSALSNFVTHDATVLYRNRHSAVCKSIIIIIIIIVIIDTLDAIDAPLYPDPDIITLSDLPCSYTSSVDSGNCAAIIFSRPYVVRPGFCYTHSFVCLPVVLSIIDCVQ